LKQEIGGLKAHTTEHMHISLLDKLGTEPSGLIPCS